MPEQSPSRQDFSLRAERDGERLLIATAGELDLTTAPDLEAALQDALPYSGLHLDLAGLTFIDSSGLRLLLSERDRAERDGSEFAISGAKGAVARVFKVSGFAVDLTPELPESRGPAAAEQPLVNADEVFRATYPAEPAAVSHIRHSLSDYARGLGVRDEVVGAAGLAVSEATTNAVVHAYVDDPEPGPITVSAGIEDGMLWVTVADDGRGMRPRPDSPGLGLGLPLIAQMAAGFEVHERDEGGTEVRIRFEL